MSDATSELDGVIAAAQEFQSWFEREVRPKLGDDIGIRAIVERASFNAWLASRGLTLDRPESPGIPLPVLIACAAAAIACGLVAIGVALALFAWK